MLTTTLCDVAMTATLSSIGGSDVRIRPFRAWPGRSLVARPRPLELLQCAAWGADRAERRADDLALRRVSPDILRRRARGAHRILKLGPAWSSPAERERWEKRLNAGIDAQLREKRNGEGPPDKGTFARVGSRVYRDRRLNNTAGRFIQLIVGYAANKGGRTEEWVPHLADELGVTTRTVERAQKV